MADMIDYLRKPVRAVIRNLAILPGVDPNRLLPLGGTAGQFPMKASDEDGDIVWADFQVDDELSLDSEFPVQNKVLASEIYQLQSQLDGIPFPSSDNPLMDGEADPGESPDFARADHVHPSDTSKADVEDVPTKVSDLLNDSGFITASDVPVEVFWATYGTTTYAAINAAINAGKLVLCHYYMLYIWNGLESYAGETYFRFTCASSSGSGTVVNRSLKVTTGNVWSTESNSAPSAATASPLMDGTAAVGSSSKYAKEDHVHPSKVFFATYGTTTNTEIEAALMADRLCACVYSGHVYYLTGASWAAQLHIAYFAADISENTSAWVKCQNGTWSNGTGTIPSAATATPLMDGTAAVGSSSKYAKEDHVHPYDTSKAAKDIYLRATLSGNSVSVASIAPFTSADALANYTDGIVWLKCLDAAAEAWIIPLINAYEIEWGEEEIEEVTCYFTFSGAVYDGSAPAVYSVVFEDVATDATSMSGTLHEMSGGGGGTSDYTDLSNKPQIGGVTLSGNKSASDLGLATATDASNKLPLAGGSMTGDIAMGSHKITGLAAGTANTDAVNKKQMEDAIAALGEVLDFKGAVQTVADLPSTGNTGGDVYFVRSLGAMFVWVETGTGGAYEWDEMGEHYDLSGYLEAPTGATANQVIAFDGNDWVAKTLVPEVSDSSTGAVTIALDPEKIYKLTGALTSLTVTLNSPSSGQHAHYHLSFDSGSTAPTVTLPGTVTMPTGFQVEASTHYEIDIFDGYGVAMSW